MFWEQRVMDGICFMKIKLTGTKSANGKKAINTNVFSTTYNSRKRSKVIPRYRVYQLEVVKTQGTKTEREVM